MRPIVLATLACLTLGVVTGAALAGDPTVPVKAIMDVTTNNWKEGDGSDWQDLFEETRLATLYSKDFAAKYRAAAKFPAYDGGTSPFDYDVIVNGQDGCPLQDLAIAVKGPKGAATEVDAVFKNVTCFGSEPEYQRASTVQFLVIEEDGKPVVDDVLTSGEDGAYSSLKAFMVEIASQGN